MSIHSALLWVMGFASLTASAIADAQPRTYTSARYNYRITVPEGWHISVPKSGVATFFNYELKEAGPQGLFPEDGAEIYLIPYGAVETVASSKTLRDWIQHNLTADHANVEIREIPASNRGSSGPQNVIEVTADFQRDSQDYEPQREVDYYFTLDKQMFRIMLLYWNDNPQGPFLQSICDSMLRSIRSAR
jgi:hypothetical protein